MLRRTEEVRSIYNDLGIPKFTLINKIVRGDKDIQSMHMPTVC